MLVGSSSHAEQEDGLQSPCLVVLTLARPRLRLAMCSSSSPPGRTVLEWEFADLGMLETSLEEDPRVRINNAKKLAMRAAQQSDSDSDDDY